MGKKMRSWGSVFRRAFPATVPVLTGFSVLGLAYGILMSSKGYGPEWSLLFSATAFCGSMQFVAVTFLTGAFAPVPAFLLSLMVNARHLFYGLSMLDKYRGVGRRKGFLIFALCDETFAINSTALVPEDMAAGDFYLAVSLLDWLYWVAASFLGGVLGNFLAVNTKGLDFALTAMFVVLFLEQMKTRKNAFCGLTGILAAVLSLMVLGGDNMVIPAMALILAVLLGGRNKLCD
ncbi:MAG TPA: AzlC family ABC transporter permease [Candidatus Faecousia intestinigallinarum]|nr:AzlC family ABC transporter permease [Candidatus Faecousia intestinigallinarum]